MEQHWDFSGNAEHLEMKRRPTEYFKKNIFVACRADENDAEIGPSRWSATTTLSETKTIRTRTVRGGGSSAS